MYEEDGLQSSAFDGNIVEIPEISVDNFEDKFRKAYFLSHMHSDHTQGLFGKDNSSQLYNNGYKIYMSEQSAIILSHNHFNYNKNLKGIVEPLKIGFTYTINVDENKSFQVTLIPVDHMVGAVMFLLKTTDKTVLYTGDFVIEPDNVCDIKKLHNNNGTPITIDTMYVDATFDNEDYEHFPTREACHQQVQDLAEDWLAIENHRLALYSNYQFGYDALYEALHYGLNVEIFIQSQYGRADIHKIYDDLHEDDNFMTEDDNSKVHVCKNKSPSGHHSSCGVTRSRGLDYLHIYISAQRGYGYSPGEASLTQVGYRSYYLCYPTHCSRSQLEFFLNYFKPTKTTKFPRNPVPTPTSKKSPYRKDDN